MRIDNQQQQNKGVMDLMPQTGAVEEKNGIQMFADAVKTESSKKSAGTTSFQAKEITYLNPAKEEKKTVIDEIEQSGSMDAGERKAQMAVLAETTSPEDYEKMQEDGFSLDDTTSNKIVTVTDKIKAQLAKAGVDISKFGDDLDLEQLAQITGSPELAVQIANSLREADLPLADDNFKQIAETVNMADSLSALDDGAVKYLIDNRLEPTVRNIYFAEHSASAGYISAEQQDISSFLPQVKNVIASAGLEVNDDTADEGESYLCTGSAPDGTDHGGRRYCRTCSRGGQRREKRTGCGDPVRLYMDGAGERRCGYRRKCHG